jgi:hypothetical protein
MLAFMLDPCYRSLEVVENYVGCGNAFHVACEYDMKVKFEMLASLPNKFLGFSGFKLKQKKCLT